jgi:heat shock protein HslJ
LLARPFLLIVVAFAIAACGSAVTPTGSDGPPAGTVPALAGTSWVVASVDGNAPMAGAVPLVAFDVDRVTGSGGCNRFGGRYQVDAVTGRFAVAELGGTLIGCVKAGVGDFETAFLTALGATSQAAIDPVGELILSGPTHRIVLVAVGPAVTD